tara:strand:- start:7318 stop:7938 length:621 start_codon:yes stop_codon:yes gene_type:complete
MIKIKLAIILIACLTNVTYSITKLNTIKINTYFGEQSQTFLTTNDMTIKCKFTKGIKLSTNFDLTQLPANIHLGLVFANSSITGQSSTKSQKISVNETRFELGFKKNYHWKWLQNLSWTTDNFNFFYGAGLHYGMYHLNDNYMKIDTNKNKTSWYLVHGTERYFSKESRWFISSSTQYNSSKIEFDKNYSLTQRLNFELGIGYNIP